MRNVYLVDKQLFFLLIPCLLLVLKEIQGETFEGEESVFCIELFCIDEKFEARLIQWTVGLIILIISFFFKKGIQYFN